MTEPCIYNIIDENGQDWLQVKQDLAGRSLSITQEN